MAEALRLSVVLLTPVMPVISDKIRDLIGAESFELIEGQLEWGRTLEGKQLGEKAILFPRPSK
jgi:methionyl-tRNA synthetase